MTDPQRTRRFILWIGSAAGGLLWLSLIIVPAVIGGHITAEQPASVITTQPAA